MEKFIRDIEKAKKELYLMKISEDIDFSEYNNISSIFNNMKKYNIVEAKKQLINLDNNHLRIFESILTKKWHPFLGLVGEGQHRPEANPLKTVHHSIVKKKQDRRQKRKKRAYADRMKNKYTQDYETTKEDYSRKSLEIGEEIMFIREGKMKEVDRKMQDRYYDMMKQPQYQKNKTKAVSDLSSEFSVPKETVVSQIQRWMNSKKSSSSSNGYKENFDHQNRIPSRLLDMITDVMKEGDIEEGPSMNDFKKKEKEKESPNKNPAAKRAAAANSMRKSANDTPRNNDKQRSDIIDRQNKDNAAANKRGITRLRNRL